MNLAQERKEYLLVALGFGPLLLLVLAGNTNALGFVTGLLIWAALVFQAPWIALLVVVGLCATVFRLDAWVALDFGSFRLYVSEVALLSVAAHALLTKGSIFMREAWFKWFTGFLFLAALSMYFAVAWLNQPAKDVAIAARIVLFSLAVVPGAAIGRDPVQLERFLNGLKWLGVALCLPMLAQNILSVNLLGTNAAFDHSLVVLPGDASVTRLVIPGARVVLLLLMLELGRLWARNLRGLDRAILMLSGLTIASTFARGLWLSTAGVLLIIAYDLIRRRNINMVKWAFALFALVVVLKVLPAGVSNSDLSARFFARFLGRWNEIGQVFSGAVEDANTNVRLLEYQMSWTWIRRSPFIGANWVQSLGNIPGVYEVYNPHNAYLGLLVRLGFLGLAPIVALSFGALRRTWQLLNKKGLDKRTCVLAGLFLEVIRTLLAGLTQQEFSQASGMFIFLMVIGALYGILHTEDREAAFAAASGGFEKGPA